MILPLIFWVYVCGLIWEEFFFCGGWLCTAPFISSLDYFPLHFSPQHSHGSGNTWCYWPPEATEEGAWEASLSSECILLLFFISLGFWFDLLCNYRFVVFYVGTWREGRKNCSWNFAWNHTHVCYTCTYLFIIIWIALFFPPRLFVELPRFFSTLQLCCWHWRTGQVWG